MAYIATFFDNEKSLVAHSPNNPNIRLVNTTVTQSVKNIDTFDFSILPNNPASYMIEEMKTMVNITNTVTNKVEFEGRIEKQTGQSASNTERRYRAADVIAFLHDTLQMPKKMTVKPSEAFRFMVNRHNSLAEDYKQFAVGVVEIDTYIAYGESAEAELVNVELVVGDTTTIKPTATHIYDWDGTQLTMANYAKGVAHKVSDIRTLNGVKQYRLSRTWPTGVTTVEGFVNASDIVEAQSTAKPGQTSNPSGELSPGTKFKIRNGVTTYYGASDGGGAVTIPPEYRNFTYTVSSHGLLNGMYGLVYNGTVIAWLPSSDVLQVDGREFDVVTPPETTQPVKIGGRYPSGTKAKIKRGVTIYYASSDGGGAVTIPMKYRELNYTVRDYSSKYKRYTIYNGSHGVAWVNEADLDFGTLYKPSQPIDRQRPAYVEKIRYIDLELKYSDSTYNAIKKHLLDPFGAEMEWEYIEGVRTLHIRKRIERETNEEIRLGSNLIRTQTDIDPTDVVTCLIPIGQPVKEESEVED